MASYLENIQQQLEESIACLSIFEEDFRVFRISSPVPGGDNPSSSCGSDGLQSHDQRIALHRQVDLEPEALLAEDGGASLLDHFDDGGGKGKGVLHVEVLVRVDLPQDGIQVRIPAGEPSRSASAPTVQEGGGMGTASEEAEELTFAAGRPLAHLPPLRLALQLPATYPSQHPPEVQELQALWLTAPQSEALTQALILQWQDGSLAGGPVVYQWVEWLKSAALPHLGISNSITVRPKVVTAVAGGDGSAASSQASWTAEEVAMSLMRWAASRSQELFLQQVCRCPICWDDVPGSACVRLPDCQHVFCSSCIGEHCRSLARDGAVDNIRCPEPSCRLQIPPHVLRSILTEEEFVRWETLVLQKGLERMEDVVYCPRCQAVCIADKDEMGQCPQCLYVFCAGCFLAWHPAQPCLDQTQRLEMLQKKADNAKLSQEERMRKNIDLANQIKSMMLVQETTKQCPNCSMAIDKFAGCNKVRCSNCYTLFCWRCRAVVEDYSHFGADTCVLFDDEEVHRWNAQQWQGARAVQVAQGGFAANFMIDGGQARPVGCPQCGQLNAKIGGANLMRCWACNNHFCALCRQALRGKPGLHFGPGRCKQHS